jgi:uncharacterized protein DUF5309
MPTIITGDVATDTVNQANRVVDMAEGVAELEPDATPLIVLLKKMRKRKASAPKVEWLENEAMPRFDTTSATAASNAATIGVVNGNYFRVGDLVRNTATGEGLEVTATASATINVTRAIGGTAAAAMGASDELFIVANANQEGSLMREIKTPQLANKFNYTQIVRTPFGVTGTEAATRLYSGPTRDTLQATQGVEHMRVWEQIALFGAKREDTSVSGRPKRFAGGAVEFITTNVTNAGGALTETSFLTFLRSGFRYGSDRKVLVAAPLVINAIEGYARTNIQVTNDRGNTYGIQMRTYVSGQGVVDIVMSRALNDSVNYRGWAFLFDLDSLFYCPLRDTKLMEDIQPNDADKIEDEYRTEASFVYEHERRHAILKGVTG